MTNKTDKELLELAAKAAGIVALYPSKDGEDYLLTYEKAWNPLTDDGDAFRLAVNLKFDVVYCIAYVSVWSYDHDIDDCEELYNSDPCAATRRAIVRAAAAIGERL